jgi:formylglycine-generating enzyme required for sulfatase activity
MGYPVVQVSWQDAMEYCTWLSAVKKETYRLPTEAEWEYAAQGGLKGQSFPWGDKIDVSKANYAPDDSRVKQPEPLSKFIRHVGSYKPNGYGLYDMAGNVWEWCYDWYTENYYASSPEENPMGPVQPTNNAGLKVRRGGSWATSADFCRINQRHSVPIDFKSPSLGFRIVKELPESKK